MAKIEFVAAAINNFAIVADADDIVTGLAVTENGRRADADDASDARERERPARPSVEKRRR